MNQLKAGQKFINLPGFDDYVRPIVSPSNNSTGIVIRTCFIYGGRLLTGSVTPTQPTLNNVPTIWLADGMIPYEIVIPAGMGLWYAPGSSNSRFYATYDVLS